jgi:hypothetical protein
MGVKPPGPPKKSRLQRKLGHAALQKAWPKPAPDPLLQEPSWFQRIYLSVLDFLGLRKTS